MAFKLGNTTVLNLDAAGSTQLASASGTDIALYPDQNVWIKEGTKLIFEGTTPDAHEAKLQATTVTADRDLIIPDEDGTLATQAYVTTQVAGVDLSTRVSLAGDTMTGILTLSGAPSSANHAATKAYVDSSVAGGVGGIDTDDVLEATNLYYTDARADARVANALTGNITIGGNLTVSGTTTTVNSNTVNIGDSIITLNSDEAGTPSQNGGIEIERGTSTNVTFVWDETNDEWTTSSETLKTGHMLPETDVTYDLGSSSLKWRDLYLSGSTIKLGGATLSASGSNLSMGSGSFDLSNSTTADLTEHVDNKYYTQARFDTAFTAKSTNDLTENTNLYYTDARVRTHIEGADLAMGANNITTTGKVLYSNVYSATGDLPAASTYHGMFAHVHGTGKGYFAHAGAWSELVDTSSSSGTNIQLNSIGAGTAASGTTGDIRATADVTAYYSSDATLKENVVEIENALDKVKKIRGVEFDWTPEYIDEKGGEDGYFVRKHDVGVIAQEVEAVLPEVVGTRDNGIKAVRYDRIVALLIEAIKDQQTQIDELKDLVNQKNNK